MSETPSEKPSDKPRRRVAWRWALGFVVLLVVVLVGTAGVGLSLLHTERATQRLLPWLPGIKVTGPRGELLGDFSADRIDIALPRSGRLSLIQPSWRDLRMSADLSVAWLFRVDVAQVRARRLELVWVAGPASKTPSAPLTEVRLPFAVSVGRLQVEQAESALWGQVPLKAVDGSLVLQAIGSSREAVHQVNLSRLVWQDWALSGTARIGVDKGMPLSARLVADNHVVSSKAGPHGMAKVEAAGPLARLHLKGKVGWQQPDRPAQSVDVDADIAPFAPWPVPRLLASVQSLNLADVHSTLPATLLRGQVKFSPTSKHDLRASIDLHNDVPGAWDAKALPVRRVGGVLDLSGVLGARDLTAAWQQGVVDLVAGVPSSEQRPDGLIKAQGGWGKGRSLKLSWTRLEPQALHGQAPPLQLDGVLDVTPEFKRTASAGKVATAASSVVASAASELQMHAGLTLQSAGVYGMSGAGKAPAARAMVPVSLSLKGRYDPGQFLVQAMSLRAQDEAADLADTLVQWGGVAPSPAWAVKGKANVRAFDPQVWVPWPAAMTGRNQLTGQVDAALDANWRGQVDARIEPSQLGGVPIAGQMQWRSPPNRQVMSASVDLNVGGNTVQGQADVPWLVGPQGQIQWGAQARWQGTVHAPALNNLQPIAPLLGAKQISGVIEAQANAQGIWPALRSDGRLSVVKLQWVAANGQVMGAASAQGEWSLGGTSLDAPWRLQLDLAQGQIADLLVDKAQMRVQGNLRQHQSSLSADATFKSHNGGKPSAFHLGVALDGGWRPQSNDWIGQVRELMLTMTAPTPRTLLEARPFQIRSHQAGDDRSLHVSDSVLSVMGAAMHLRKFDWQWSGANGGAVGDTEVVLDLDPLNLPNLLASWQPQAGWGGDLLLAGQVKLKHSASQPWAVDAYVARQSGDISLSEPTIRGNSAQRLGIREARVALQARDGVWALSEHFEGRVMGVLKGRQVVQARSPNVLPVASDPLSGEIDLQISNLRPLGTWVPAGWRLTGEMEAKAQLSGTLGVPQYRGQVRGQKLGLSEALQGVNLTDGVLQLELEGERVTLSQFAAQGGLQGGRISAQGEALLGEQPQAKLTVKAERFALLQRVDRRVVISGDAQAAFGEEDISVDGRLQVDEGLIDISRSEAPVVGDDVNVLNRPGQQAEEEAEAGPPSSKRKLNANVIVDLGHHLRLKGHGLEAILAGSLRLTTPANKPSVNGTIHVENGTYAAYGQKLVIERGDIAFTGPIENPRLDILAMRPQSPTASSSDVKVGVTITGTAQDPRVRLYSDPAMSETEQLSWLVLGRAPTGLGGADIGLLQSAAVALLSGEGGAPSDNLVTKLGLDELSVRQSEGTGSTRDTVVNLGKQVSKYWYVGYERNLNATSGNWQLIYRLAQRFMVRAQAGDDNAVDFIWSWKWD